MIRNVLPPISQLKLPNDDNVILQVPPCQVPATTQPKAPNGTWLPGTVISLPGVAQRSVSTLPPPMVIAESGSMRKVYGVAGFGSLGAPAEVAKRSMLFTAPWHWENGW